MRTTAFGDMVLQPGDDFFAEWTMFFDDSPVGEVARFLEEDDGKWGCEITDNNDHTAQANDFESEAALRAWLTQNKIEID